MKVISQVHFSHSGYDAAYLQVRRYVHAMLHATGCWHGAACRHNIADLQLSSQVCGLRIYQSAYRSCTDRVCLCIVFAGGLPSFCISVGNAVELELSQKVWEFDGDWRVSSVCNCAYWPRSNKAEMLCFLLFKLIWWTLFMIVAYTRRQLLWCCASSLLSQHICDVSVTAELHRTFYIVNCCYFWSLCKQNRCQYWLTDWLMLVM